MTIITYFIATIGVAAVLTACSSTGDSDKNNDINVAPTLEYIPIGYRPDVQQGNVIEQSQLAQLRPGLSKSQVRFIMGTPLLQDPFHASRWDYVYNMTKGWDDTQQRLVQVYFDKDGMMQRVEGDIQSPSASDAQPKLEVAISIPDYQDPNRGIIKQAAEQISTLFTDDAPTTPTANVEVKADPKISTPE